MDPNLIGLVVLKEQVGVVVICQGTSDSRDPMDRSPPGSSIQGILQARILKGHSLLQGIFLTQGSNPSLFHLLYCRLILYCRATGEPQ